MLRKHPTLQVTRLQVESQPLRGCCAVIVCQRARPCAGMLNECAHGHALADEMREQLANNGWLLPEKVSWQKELTGMVGMVARACAGD